MPTSVGSYTNNEVPKPPKPPTPSISPGKSTDNRTINASDVLSRAEHLSHGDNQFKGYCSAFVQQAGMGPNASPQGHAGDWYNKVNRQGAVNTTSAPPAGTAVFYDTSNVNDHVAVSAGNGYVWSTGIGGKIKKVPLDNLYGGGAGSTPNRGWTSRFGNQYVKYDKSGLADSGKPSSATSGKSNAAPQPKPSPSAGAAPEAPSTVQTAMTEEAPSGPLAGDISVLNPNKSVQFGNLNTSGPMVVR